MSYLSSSDDGKYIWPTNLICMMCGKQNDNRRTELLWTGDLESYRGLERWARCDECGTETFYKLKPIKKD